MKKILSLSIGLFLITTCLLIAQTPPDEFLGHKVGADRKLADYKQIQAYFEKLDQESDRVQVLNIGKTTLGKDMIMAVITSEKNMAELEKYKRSTLKGMIDAMKSNSTMAAMLTEAEAVRGNWALIFDDINEVNAVTADDVKRVAATYLVTKQKTIGEIIPENN